MPWILGIFILMVLDQGVKYLIVARLSKSEFIPVINHFFYLTYWENRGAAWGIMQNKRTILLLVTLLAIVLLAYLLKKSESKLSSYAITMIMGGALGNFIDRVFREGGVVDFLLFQFGNYEFPAFNVADMLIVSGTVLLVLATIIEAKKEKAIRTHSNEEQE